MLTESNGRIAPAGGAMPAKAGRILLSTLETKRREITAAAHDIVAGLIEAATPPNGRLLDFAPIPKAQPDGSPFKVRREPKYFHSGEKTFHPD